MSLVGNEVEAAQFMTAASGSKRTLPKNSDLQCFLVLATVNHYYEILQRTWGERVALRWTTVLFVVPHLIWDPAARNILSVLSLTVTSVIFTYAYKHGGIWAAIIPHSFWNFYVLCVLY